MKKIIIIPARLHSTRLPQKVLLDLGGKPVIQRVYERCLQARDIEAVYIATDSQEVYDVCRVFTEHIVMTASHHMSGTDRVAEAIAHIPCDIVINIQGDEPFVDPRLIEKLAEAFSDEDTQMVSAMHRIRECKELHSQNVVKVVTDSQQRALYFSRSVIPFYRDRAELLHGCEGRIPEDLVFYRHLGVYAYRRAFLLSYGALPQSALEKAEKLEQLMVLESGYQITMVETDQGSIGIDTQEDYNKAKEYIHG